MLGVALAILISFSPLTQGAVVPRDGETLADVFRRNSIPLPPDRVPHLHSTITS
jgi:hypothetical protein